MSVAPHGLGPSGHLADSTVTQEPQVGVRDPAPWRWGTRSEAPHGFFRGPVTGTPRGSSLEGKQLHLGLSGGQPMPSFLSTLQGICLLSLPSLSPQLPAIPCPWPGPSPVCDLGRAGPALPPPGVQSRSEALRHRRGGRGGLEVWRPLAVSPDAPAAHVHACAGPG